MYTSETGNVGLSIQDVKGTFKAPTDFMKVSSIDLNPEGDKLIPDPEIGSISDIDSIHQGTYKISGSIESYIRPEAIGILFYGALGYKTASGAVDTGAYLHNFTPIASGSLPWISIKKTISDNIQVFNYKDCKVDGFTIDINASEFATSTFDIVGISDEIGTPVTASYETAPILVATKATINIGGIAVSAKTASIEFRNNLESDDFRIGSRFLGDIEEKRREININMDIVLDTTSELYKKSFYGAANVSQAGFLVHAESVDILLESQTNIGSSTTPYKILFQIKNATFMAAPTPASGDDLVVIPLELKATKLSGQNIMEVHIWNSKASY